jgi:hypothetical protein
MKFLSDILVKAGLTVENTFSANAASNTIYAGSGTRLRTEANNLVFERVSSSGTMKMIFAQGTLSPNAKSYIGYSNATLNLILANEFATAGLELRTSDIIRQQIFANGNIVIGQASPVDAGFKVDITGTARISSTTTLSSLAGTGDRMVVANSSGVLSTQAIPSGNFVTLDTTQTIAGLKTFTSKATINTGGTDDQLQLVGTAPSIRLTNAVTGATINGFIAMAGASNNYIQGAVAGDMTIGNQNNGRILFGFGSGTATQKMSLDANGNAVISGGLTIGSTLSNGVYTYTLPSATGTLALASSLSSYVPTSRTITINGTSYDLSADRAWSIATGVSSIASGTGIVVATVNGVATVSNLGILGATSGTGIVVSTNNQNITITNLGLLSAASGNGIAVSTSNQQITITNTGVLSIASGTGIVASTVNGVTTITNLITNTNQLTNGAGYITGINSSMVTSALGYTPYNSSNPNGYISSYTETDTLASVTARGSSTASGITFTAPGGSILLKHAVSEVDAWIFQENAANWGIYWKNAPSGHHTFGGYTTVGAETFGMSAANSSGNGVLTSNFVGATSAYAQWMLSNYTGYIWSASTIFAAGDMRAPQFRFTNSGNSAYMTGDAGWGARIQTDSGYILFGPANGSYAHIYTDRGQFYFNKDILINNVQVVVNSGTWGINITGNAATATNLSNNQSNWSGVGGLTNVIGLLAWKNYGNNHVIFDASQGTSPSGGGVSQVNATYAWAASYPTLMGWNGSNTYGVRVDSARVADTAGSLSSMNISQFTNNSGYITSSALSSYLPLSGGNITGRVEFQYSSDKYSQAWRNNSTGAYWWVTTESDKLGFHRNGDGDKFYFSNGGDFWSSTNGWLSTALAGKQNSSSAITTSNISSQSVNFASSAGTVTGRQRGSFTVGGNVSTFYPVAFQIGSGSTGEQGVSVLQIERGGYDEPGYSNHTFTTFHARIRAKADGWGFGASYVQVEANAYTTPMMADVTQQNQTSQLIVWLRGGTAYRWMDIEGGWSLNFSNPSGGDYSTFNGNSVYSPTTSNTIGGNFKYQQGWGNNYISGTFTAGGDVRAPIFYDSQDTSFYLDPNSYSRLSRVGVGGGANDVSGININGDAALTGANFFYFGHNNGSLGSWQTRTFASGGRQIWNTNGFEVNRDGYGGGLLFSVSSSGATSIPGNTTWFSGQAALALENQSSFARYAFYKLDFWDWDHGRQMVLDGNYVYVDNYLQAGNSLRAPIFYDSNDTGYYLDPNGTSNLQTWTADTAARLGRSRYWTNRWARYGYMNGHMTGTNGWGMEEGGWDTAWKGGFSGWDIWGSGTGHPQGGGYIHAQGIVSGLHHVATDGSDAYGWMMVGAHNATENRYWLRGRWSNSTSGWVEMITTGNIASYAINRNGDTISGVVNFRTNQGGYLGSLDTARLQVYSDSNNSAFMSFHKGGYYAVNFGLDADNVMRIGGWSASANRWQLDMSGNMTVAGDVTAYSDARVKTNVHTIENALEKVLALRGVSYTRTDSEDKKTKIGVIAQETLPIVPEVVNQDNDGMFNVSYGNFGGLFIEAFKEQQRQIEELKSIINALTK